MKSLLFEPADQSPPPGWWRGGLTGPLTAGAVLAVFWVLLLASLRDKSPAWDETVHAAAGYTYWKFNDYRIQPENGNLPQQVIGLPLVLSGYRFPSTDSKLWRTADQWELADEWFHKMGNDVEGMLLRGRAANGLLAVALGALVWWWSRRIFGPWGGLLSLLLYVLNPTILANGALMTSDTACSLFFLASTLGVWTVLHRLSVFRVLLSALAMGGLFVSKMSAFLIVPVALTLVAARLLDGRPLPVVLGGKEHTMTGRKQQALAFVPAALVHAVVVVIVIWGCYGFRFAALAHPRPGLDQNTFTWEHLLDKPSPAVLLGQLNLDPTQQARVREIFETRHVQPNQWPHGAFGAMQVVRQAVLTPAQVQKLDELASAPPAALVPRLMEFSNRHRLLPEAYVYGHAHVWKYLRSRTAFLNGRFGVYGWKSFFPYTFLVKTPLPVFGVIGLALVAAMARGPDATMQEGGGRSRRLGVRKFYETLPLWTLLAFFWAAVIPSHLNIGHRHLMPTYAPLFVLCGAAARWLDGWSGLGAGGRAAAASGRRAGGVALAGLLAALAAEVLYRFPNYLAYFNGFVSPARAYRHLVDSSLDWGQDLPGVRRYLETHRLTGPVYLSYFGNGSPDYYRIPAKHLHSLPGRDGRQSPPVRLTAGTYFISASMLQPVMYGRSGPRGPWNDHYEAVYQELRRAVEPLLSDHPADRPAALKQHSIAEWQGVLKDFDQFRFARLTAYLRQREPDDHVNFSILVYHLTGADLVRALDGPPPELDPVAELRRYEEAVRFEPGSATAHGELGAVLFRRGRLAEAISHYKEALRLQPGSDEMHNYLGLALAQSGRMPEALEQYRNALQLQPGSVEAHYNFGNALLSLGRGAEAAGHYEEALRLKPDYAEAHNNLGAVLLQMGRVAEAVGHYEEALRLKPDYADARDNLALARAFQQTPGSVK